MQFLKTKGIISVLHKSKKRVLFISLEIKNIT